MIPEWEFWLGLICLQVRPVRTCGFNKTPRKILIPVVRRKGSLPFMDVYNVSWTFTMYHELHHFWSGNWRSTILNNFFSANLDKEEPDWTQIFLILEHQLFHITHTFLLFNFFHKGLQILWVCSGWKVWCIPTCQPLKSRWPWGYLN